MKRILFVFVTMLVGITLASCDKGSKLKVTWDFGSKGKEVNVSQLDQFEVKTDVVATDSKGVKYEKDALEVTVKSGENKIVKDKLECKTPGTTVLKYAVKIDEVTYTEERKIQVASDYSVSIEFTKDGEKIGNTLEVPYRTRLNLAEGVTVTDSKGIGHANKLEMTIKNGQNEIKVEKGVSILLCNISEETVVEYKVVVYGLTFTVDRTIKVATVNLGPNIIDWAAVKSNTPVFGVADDAIKKPNSVYFWSIGDPGWNLGPVSEGGASFEGDALKLDFSMPEFSISAFAVQWFLGIPAEKGQYALKFNLTSTLTRSLIVNGVVINVEANVKEEQYIAIEHKANEPLVILIQASSGSGIEEVLPGNGSYLLENLYLGKTGDVEVPPVEVLDNYFMVDGIDSEPHNHGEIGNKLGTWFSKEGSWSGSVATTAQLSEKDGVYQYEYNTTGNPNHWSAQVLLNSRPIAEEGTYVVSMKVSASTARDIYVLGGFNSKGVSVINVSGETGETITGVFGLTEEFVELSFEIVVTTAGDVFNFQINAGGDTQGSLFLKDFSLTKK